jgi:holin-like protein
MLSVFCLAFCQPGGHSRKMIRGLAILLVFQSLGEMSSRIVNGAVPGPVIGLLLLLAFLVLRRSISPSISLAADGLLAHLSIFFIPAAVGVMLYASTLASTGAAWILAIVLSTAAAISVTALVLRAMSRRGGDSEAAVDAAKTE